MNPIIEDDDLALLVEGFEAAMAEAPGPAQADEALHNLGWAELLGAAPARGAATAFGALGTTGSAAGLLDDVVAQTLNGAASIDTCVVFPAPHRSDAPARRHGGHIEIHGLVSARSQRAATALVAVDVTGAVEVAGAVDITGAVEVAVVDTALLPISTAEGMDPGRAYTRVAGEIPAERFDRQTVSADWASAVTAARTALAHQLLGGARWMLAQARRHAIDRVQFGRPVASFQAIRHKLAECLVQIEGASSVAEACARHPDPLLAALAKSLAGRAAHTTAAHTQQVLAGIGFTDEHRFHLWFKRMLVLDTLFGSASSLPTEIGRRLLTRGRAPRLIQL